MISKGKKIISRKILKMKFTNTILISDIEQT